VLFLSFRKHPQEYTLVHKQSTTAFILNHRYITMMQVVCTQAALVANKIYVSETDILGPNGNLSDIENLVSFERELFEDSSY